MIFFFFFLVGISQCEVGLGLWEIDTDFVFSGFGGAFLNLYFSDVKNDSLIIIEDEIKNEGVECLEGYIDVNSETFFGIVENALQSDFSCSLPLPSFESSCYGEKIALKVENASMAKSENTFAVLAKEDVSSWNIVETTTSHLQGYTFTDERVFKSCYYGHNVDDIFGECTHNFFQLSVQVVPTLRQTSYTNSFYFKLDVFENNELIILFVPEVKDEDSFFVSINSYDEDFLSFQEDESSIFEFHFEQLCEELPDNLSFNFSVLVDGSYDDKTENNDLIDINDYNSIVTFTPRREKYYAVHGNLSPVEDFDLSISPFSLLGEEKEETPDQYRLIIGKNSSVFLQEYDYIRVQNVLLKYKLLNETEEDSYHIIEMNEIDCQSCVFDLNPVDVEADTSTIVKDINIEISEFFSALGDYSYYLDFEIDLIKMNEEKEIERKRTIHVSRHDEYRSLSFIESSLFPGVVATLAIVMGMVMTSVGTGLVGLLVLDKLGFASISVANSLSINKHAHKHEKFMFGKFTEVEHQHQQSNEKKKNECVRLIDLSFKYRHKNIDLGSEQSAMSGQQLQQPSSPMVDEESRSKKKKKKNVGESVIGTISSASLENQREQEQKRFQASFQSLPSSLSTHGDKISFVRATKYSVYSHCKNCFMEQHNFFNQKANRGKFSDKSQNCCIKCGLPLINFVDFEKDESFCVVCSVFFKYDRKNHGRCTLHLSNPKKNTGCTFVLYKNKFSASGASKKKRPSKDYSKFLHITENEIWKLNNIMKFEMLKGLQPLIGRELCHPLVGVEETTLMRNVIQYYRNRKEMIRGIGEFVFHKKKIDISKFSEGNKRKFYENIGIMFDRLIFSFQQQIRINAQLRERDRKRYECSKAGKKRKRIEVEYFVNNEGNNDEFSPANKKQKTNNDRESSPNSDVKRNDSLAQGPRAPSVFSSCRPAFFKKNRVFSLFTEKQSPSSSSPTVVSSSQMNHNQKTMKRFNSNNSNTSPTREMMTEEERNYHEKIMKFGSIHGFQSNVAPPPPPPPQLFHRKVTYIPDGRNHHFSEHLMSQNENGNDGLSNDNDNSTILPPPLFNSSTSPLTSSLPTKLPSFPQFQKTVDNNELNPGFTPTHIINNIKLPSFKNRFPEMNEDFYGQNEFFNNMSPHHTNGNLWALKVSNLHLGAINEHSDNSSTSRYSDDGSDEHENPLFMGEDGFLRRSLSDHSSFGSFGSFGSHSHGSHGGSFGSHGSFGSFFGNRATSPGRGSDTSVNGNGSDVESASDGGTPRTGTGTGTGSDVSNPTTRSRKNSVIVEKYFPKEGDNLVLVNNPFGIEFEEPVGSYNLEQFLETTKEGNYFDVEDNPVFISNMANRN